jgi:hypothetical protein
MEMTADISVTPTIDTLIYASGDRVGTVMDFAGATQTPGGAGRVWGVRITDRAVQKSALNLWLFKLTPTVASADNAALDITDANLDAAQPVGFVSIATTDYVDTASNAVAFRYLANPGLPFVTAGDGGVVGATGHLFGLLESGGTPTYGAANALTVTLLVEQE